MTLLEKYRDVLRRAEDVHPLEPRVRQIITEGKRDQLQRGVDVQGKPFVGVAPSTRKTRGGIGPPLAPRGAQSRIVREFTVRFERAREGLVVVMGWPMEWVKYHVTGTRHMPRRDPTGVRERDRRAILRALSEWVRKGRR